MPVSGSWGRPQEATTSAFYYVTVLVTGIICAIACYVIADTKGRSVVLWPILESLFPIIGLVIVLVLPRRSSS